jgi:hypothetical protein
MIPLYCIVDSKPIPDERVRRGAKTCGRDCQKIFRRAFLLDRKERYRKAAGLPPSPKSTSGQRNSVPGAVCAEEVVRAEDLDGRERDYSVVSMTPRQDQTCAENTSPK